MISPSALVAELIRLDVDDSMNKAAALLPTSQREVLFECLQRLASRAPQETIESYLTIAQSILAGPHPHLTEPEAVGWLERLIPFAREQTDNSIRGQAFTVVALIFNRLREGVGLLPDAVRKAFQEVASKPASEGERGITASIASKLKAFEERATPRSFAGDRSFRVPDLNVTKAGENVQHDIIGDWYHDPWGWPEVPWLVRSRPDRVLSRLRTNACDWSVPLDVAKQGGGIRPAVLLNPLDRIAYQSIVDDLSLETIGGLPDWVYGWRLSRRKPSKGAYVDNGDEWKSFRRCVVNNSKLFPFTAHLDVQSFFSSVNTSVLLAQVSRTYRNNPVVDRLESYFECWHQAPNGSGIPQRSLASSVLAHAILRPLDAFLNALSRRPDQQFASARWMDDIWLFARDERSLRQTVTETEGILGQIHLTLNAEKTAFFESTETGEVVHLVDVSSGTESGSPDSTSLSPDTLLGRAEDAPRFTIGLAARKMIKKNDFTPLARLASNALGQFTHAADHLAEALRISGLWKNHVDWYLAFARRHLVGESWSVAAWAEMFPSSPDRAVEKVHSYFASGFPGQLLRVLTPIAAQRLSAWRSLWGAAHVTDTGVRESGTLHDAFKFRAVCFAALDSGLSKDVVGPIANDAADDVTNEFLKDTGFAAPAYRKLPNG